MPLLFYWLFPHGIEHYSLVAKNTDDMLDDQGHIIPEGYGGIAQASRHNVLGRYK